MAPALEERQRMGVVVRHAERRQHRQRVEASRTRALHRRAGRHRTGPARQPAAGDARSWRLDRRRHEVRRHAGADPQRNGESRLRTGRGRSRGGQPERVRDLLRGEAAVLHRRLGQLSVPVPRLQHVLHAPHRPATARLPDARSGRVRIGAAKLDDSRRGQTDRARARLFGRRADGGHTGGAGARRRLATSAGARWWSR